ncbi:GGDEF domain-containing protein [Sphingorhabdus pulchriflava]|uniref:GGDEF domain-containing protein n=1 Tax=Sphingorhabdus pulchriflava TaxID=2292257 RepID=UPI0011C04AF0|nr:GGDEF domain-containing protein [Sphingorhabdus pulchriflava]
MFITWGRIRTSVITDKIFFWVLPVMYGVFTAAFVTLARSESGASSAKKGAAAFGMGMLAIILDTQRTLFPSWFFTMAVPLHWLVLWYMADAFLVRHGDQTPVKPALALFFTGLAINLAATFIVDSVAIRVPNASIVAIALLTLALPRFFAHRAKRLDNITAFVIAMCWLCYIVRFAFYFTLDQSGEYARTSQWSQYMMIFYFTSAIFALSLAFLLMMAITSDLVARHFVAATVDPLTGVANRRGFERMLDEPHDVLPFHSVLMVDLDHFKQVNDTHGHGVGDGVLVAVSQTLISCCKGLGEVVRFGGEEFVVLLRPSERQAVLQVAELLRSAIAATRLGAPHHHLQVTASMGVAVLEPDENIDDAIRRADRALYRAKENGRNRVVFAETGKLNLHSVAAVSA